MKKIIAVVCFVISQQLSAQTNLSEQMIATCMNTWKDSFAFGDKPARWSYDMGCYIERCRKSVVEYRQCKIFQLHTKVDGFLCKGRWHYQRL